MGLLADDIRVMGVLPGDCEMGMTEAFLRIKRVNSCVQFTVLDSPLP